MSLRSHSRFRWFAVAALGYCIAVVTWGAYVRATGAGAGCGAHWPACNGELVPREPSTKTLIELTHRVTSGLSLLSVVVLAVWARRLFAKGHPVRRAAAASLGFMLLEALLGALLVKLELVADNATANRAVAMSLHLVNTFMLLAAMTSTTARAWLPDGGPRASSDRGLFWAMVAVVVVGVSGAVTALGDTLQQQAVQSAFVDALIRLRLAHPLLAVATAAGVLTVSSLAAASGPVARRWSTGLAAAVVLQLGVGLVNVALLAPVPVQLLHLVVADVVWVLLVVLREVVLRSGAVSAAPPSHQLLEE